MAGKGRKRREKNFRAAHGGFSRLPPPPESSQIEALPSKLKKLMQLRRNLDSPQGLLSAQGKHGGGGERGSFARRDKAQQNQNQNQKTNSSNEPLETNNTGNYDKKVASTKRKKSEADLEQEGSHEVTKKKKKRKRVEDLRFTSGTNDLQSSVSDRRSRRKKYLADKKKGNKKSKVDVDKEVPVYDKIKFGEIVDAPPKLVVPKAVKNHVSVSNERLRLRAIEAYRTQKKSSLRLGVDPATEPTVLN